MIDQNEEVRHGAVYVIEEFTSEPPEPRYLGHWKRDDYFTNGPGWDSVEQAIAWARQRAPIVLLMTGTASELRHWSAGVEKVERYGDETVVEWGGFVPAAEKQL